MENVEKETRVIIRGINPYGYRFELPGTLPEYLYNYNLNNYKRAHSFIVDISMMGHDGKVEQKSINFSSSCFGLPLNSTSLYWTEIQFEDGSVLHNENEQQLLDAAHINKLTYEFNHKAKFDDELNKYVGHPIFCRKKNREGLTQGGLLLSVNPAGKDIPVVCACVGAGTYYMQLRNDNEMIVYDVHGKGLETIATVGSKNHEESQPGQE